MNNPVAGSQGNWNYVYDVWGNLTQVYRNGQLVYEAKYDAFGNRVWAKVGSQERYYLYEGDTLVAELDASGNLVAEYVWGLVGPIARVSAQGVQLYVLDGLGHVRALLGRTDNRWQITDTYAYDSWGNLLGRTGNTNQPFTWNGAYGYEYVPATGLYHIGAREYDPRTARWLQRDPIDAASGDLNLYRYALNNPTGLVDPTGTKAMVAGCECPANLLSRNNDSSPADSGDWFDRLTNFFAGWGDTLSFGATGWIRRGLGVDSAVDYNSGWYRGGEWTGLAHSTLLGGAAGWARNSAMRGLSRANPAFPRGREFVEGSHWFPARYHWIPAWLRNSALNIKYMWGTEHALCDPFRYRFMPRWWKDANSPYPAWRGLIYRTPSSVTGGAAGAAYGGTSAAIRRFDL